MEHYVKLERNSVDFGKVNFMVFRKFNSIQFIDIFRWFTWHDRRCWVTWNWKFQNILKRRIGLLAEKEEFQFIHL